MLRATSVRAPSFRGALIALVGALVTAGCGPDDADHLVASVERLDFGTVAHGRDEERRITVTNEGRRSVVLVAVAPSCKCFVIDPTYQRSLQPDESTEVVVRLVTTQVNPQKLEGKSVSIRSDDGTVPELLIPVYGEIVSQLQVAPKLLRVSAADAAGRGQPRRIKVRTPAGYTVTPARPPDVLQPDWFDVREERGPEGGLDYLVTVKRDESRRGSAKTYLRFHLTVTGPGGPPVNYEELVFVEGTW